MGAGGASLARSGLWSSFRLCLPFDFVKVRALVNDNIEYVNAQPSGRWTAIHQAALDGDQDTIKFLIDKGADLKCKTRDGQVPYEVAKDAACKAMLQPPSGKSKAPAPAGPAPKSQKVSMKGDVVQKIASVKTGSDVKMVVKGRAAVDTGFKNASEFHVYESGDDIYDATLNQAQQHLDALRAHGDLLASKLSYYRSLSRTMEPQDQALLEPPSWIFDPSPTAIFLRGVDKDSGRAGSPGLIFSLWNTMMGSTLLVMPFAFQRGMRTLANYLVVNAAV